MDISQFIEEDYFSPTLIASSLRTQESEIANTLGLDSAAVTQGDRFRVKETQLRFGELVEILVRVEAEIGSLLKAYEWFKTQPLPSFGGDTPGKLVRIGKASAVHAYLDRIRDGGYA